VLAGGAAVRAASGIANGPLRASKSSGPHKAGQFREQPRIAFQAKANVVS